MTAHSVVLLVHSSLRWVVLALYLLVILSSARGWIGARDWSPSSERLHVSLVSVANLQFLLGLGLYLIFSPITAAFFAAPKAAMQDPTLRFFGVEHITAMFLGIALLHVGRERSRSLSDGKKRQRRVFGWTLAAFLLVLSGVPWPSLPYGRPLLRWGIPHTAPLSACPPTYRTRCAACHGEAGKGDGLGAVSLKPPPRNFTDPSWTLRSDAELAAIIRQGGGAHQLSVAMPAHPDLTDAELGALITCLRSFRNAN